MYTNRVHGIWKRKLRFAEALRDRISSLYEVALPKGKASFEGHNRQIIFLTSGVHESFAR